MTSARFFSGLCCIGLIIGITTLGVIQPAMADIDPPAGSGAPSGTVGGGSRSSKPRHQLDIGKLTQPIAQHSELVRRFV